MKTLLNELNDLFEEAMRIRFPDAPKTSHLTQSKSDKFGHYQFNSAMRLAKELKMAPHEIAKVLKEEVASKEHPLIAKMEIAGPGFINITLSPRELERRVQILLSDPKLSVEMPKKKQRVIVEFSSPNIAKELHVGHLRSTIIGDSLARLFEFMGHDVLRLNHLGDWGTAFGMLIAHMKECASAVLNREEETDLSHLVKWYRESKRRFDTEEAFKKQSQLEVVALQGGDETALLAWRMICRISKRAYLQIYDLLGVKIEDRGESFYNPMLPELIDDLEKKNLITLSDKAKCIFMEGFVNREGNPLPYIVQKSDGGFNYDTTDLAAMKYRVEKDLADRIIVVTDAGQALHFSMAHKAALLAGYINPNQTRFDHVPFGVVLGSDGRKFRTREGEVEKLIDLIENAIARAREIIVQRNPDMPEKEQKLLAETLGIDALKYADLSSHRISDYTFSTERMLRFEGNTAPFLLYSYARINGIKRQVGLDIGALKGAIHLEHPSEIALGLHLLQFSETLASITEDLCPHRLADYLYQLAEAFNAFFRDCRVKETKEQESRLLLCEATARVLKQGLDLLGLKIVEKM